MKFRICHLFIIFLLIPTVALAGSLQSMAISVADLSNPFFEQLVRSATEKAQQLAGDEVKVLVRSSAYDLNRQIQQMDEFIAAKVDLVVLVAADEYGIESAVHKAQRAGIRVVAVDVNAAGADATITTDNIQAGELACQNMVAHLSGKGRVVIINGAPVSSVIERVAGCKSVLNDYPDIQLLSDHINGSGSEEGGLEAMTYLMEAYHHIDAVFTINDPTASGSLEAARQAGRSEFVIASVDGAPAAITALARHDPIWLGTSAQFPRAMAQTAVEIGTRLLAGDEVEPRTILIPSQFISADNVEQYDGW